jgi:DNA-binding MarR family transcriptional regulator
MTEEQLTPDVMEIQRSLARLSHLLTRARQHERTAAQAGVADVTRATTPILRLLVKSGSMRPGEIAACLEVEPPHIARQVHLLERSGYVERVPDPDDRRSYGVQLTPAGREAIDRFDQVAGRQMRQALAEWTPRERAELATHLTRMVDDFFAYAAETDGVATVRGAS